MIVNLRNVKNAIEEIEILDGSIHTVQIGDALLVVSFAVWAHDEAGEPHYHLYHIAHRTNTSDKNFLNMAINETNIALQNAATHSISGAVKGGVLGAVRGAKDATNFEYGATAAKANIKSIIGRSAHTGAIRGGKNAIIFSLAKSIADFAYNQAKHFINQRSPDFVYVNTTDEFGSVYIGPWWK